MTQPTAQGAIIRTGERRPGQRSQPTVDAKRRNAEHWVIRVATPEPGYAVLRLMEYPAWRVTVDGKPAQDRPHGTMD